jgi:hypothetical protein
VYVGAGDLIWVCFFEFCFFEEQLRKCKVARFDPAGRPERGDGRREKRPQGFSRWALGAGTDAGSGSDPERQVLETPGVFEHQAGRMGMRGIGMPGIRMPGIGMPWLCTRLVQVSGKKLISVHEWRPSLGGLRFKIEG